MILRKGRVSSGRGKASNQLDWGDSDLAELLGNIPVRGTLNLVLEEPVDLVWPPDLVMNGGRAFFWLSMIGKLPCLAYRWKTCPLHIVEIVSAVGLRETLRLSDGTIVEICLPTGPEPGSARRLVWSLLWENRPNDYYLDPGRVARLQRWQGLFRIACQHRPFAVADGLRGRTS